MTTLFCYPKMLIPHIEETELKLPDDLDTFNTEEYIHFYVFKILHLGVPINTDYLLHNADVIAKIPTNEIRTITMGDLISKGLHIEYGRNLV